MTAEPINYYMSRYSGEQIDAILDLMNPQVPVVSNQNLLDNWYFIMPVNQKGVSGTITTPGYFIDRWKLTSGSVTVADGGLMLNGTISQILEHPVTQSVTASCLTDSEIIPAVYNNASKTFSVTASGTLIRAAKLELGSKSTIALQDPEGALVLNDPPPNCALELLRCQRYFYRWAAPYLSGTGLARNGSIILAYISFPATMRDGGNPALTYSLGTAARAWDYATESWLTGNQISDIIFTQFMGNIAQIELVSDGLTIGKTYRYQIAGGHIDFDRNL